MKRPHTSESIYDEFGNTALSESRVAEVGFAEGVFPNSQSRILLTPKPYGPYTSNPKKSKPYRPYTLNRKKSRVVEVVFTEGVLKPLNPIHPEP